MDLTMARKGSDMCHTTRFCVGMQVVRTGQYSAVNVTHDVFVDGQHVYLAAGGGGQAWGLFVLHSDR
jgi:hypothetical protein